MIETYWNEDGKLYYYDNVARRAQWDRPEGYQIPHSSIANHPWFAFSDLDGKPYWRNAINKSVVWKMPEVFREAIYTAVQQNVGAPCRHNPPFLAEALAYDQEALDVAENDLLEYTIRLSLEEHGNKPSLGKGKGKGKEKASQSIKDRERRGREKNVLLTSVSTTNVPLIPNDVPGRCAACFDKTIVSKVPCGCKYCQNCLAVIFIQALEEDKFSQPRCCGRMLPMDLAIPILKQIGIDTAATKEAPTTPTKGKAGTESDKGKARSKGKSKNTLAEGLNADAQVMDRVDCLICMDTFDEKDVIKTPCQHHYCRDCMKRHFVEATRNESLYPPKCCDRDIPIMIANAVLNAQEHTEFTKKGIEFRTNDRLYCSYKRCSAFIHPTRISNDVGVCSQCRRGTCIFCKGPYHWGDCPKDKGTQEILKLAQKSGWRRCYSCKVMVELDKGCNHITCGCGAQFCYMCGAKWRTCGCQLWQQENLEELYGPGGNGYVPDEGEYDGAADRDPHPRFEPMRPGWPWIYDY